MLFVDAFETVIAPFQNYEKPFRPLFCFDNNFLKLFCFSAASLKFETSCELKAFQFPPCIFSQRRREG